MTVRPAADYDDAEGILRLSGPHFYLVVRITPEELTSLNGVDDALWADRGSIRAGESLGHPVFWCRGTSSSTGVSVLVGQDDETWDLSVEIPAAILAPVVRDTAT